MHFSLSFSSLLTSLFIVLLTQHVEASPLPKRHTKSITLPLKRTPQPDGIHPLVAVQQQINRADKRLARMTSREPPTHAELTARLQKRIDDLHEAGELNKLDKRYNRMGLQKNDKRYFRMPVPVVSDDTNGDADSFLVGGVRLGGNGNGNGNGRGGGGNGKCKNGGNNNGNNGNNNNNGADEADGAADAVDAVDEADAVDGGGVGVQDPATGDQVDPPVNSGAIGGPVSGINVAQANDPQTDNSLGLHVEGPDVGYLATINIGTPPRPFLVLMDSGSADFWVGSENCQGDQGGDCGNHQFLGQQTSDTFVDSGTQFSVTYGTGAVSGTIIQDNLDIAGLQLEGHTFGVADVESVDFSSNTTPFDGLMGLARGQLANQGVPTPVEALQQNGLIDDAITSYKISRVADGLNDGEITFGALDETKFDPQTLVTLENVSPAGFYQTNMDAVAVDGTDLGLQGRTAIIDTGTTLIIAPNDDAIAVLSAVQGANQIQGSFTVPCDTQAVVSLTFGGQEFTIQPEDLATGQVIQGNNCLSGIQAGNIAGADVWLVGDVFLKNAYFSTDATQNTMALAKLV